MAHSTPTATSAAIRLSPQQRRASQGPGRCVRMALQLTGNIDMAALLEAVGISVQRHGILRTLYPDWVGGIQTQVVSALTPCISIVKEAASPAEALLGESDEVLDPACTPPLRVILARSGEEGLIVGIDASALCADPISLRLWVHEIMEIYAGLRQQRPIPEPGPQYSDFAGTLNELLEASESQAARQYWAQALKPGLLEGFEQPRELRQSSRFGSVTLLLPRSSDPAFEPRAGLLACWQILLARRFRAGAPALGVGVDGRTYEGMDRALGPFARYVPLLSSSETGTTFAGLAQGYEGLLGEAAESQEFFSWETLGADLGRPDARFWFPFLFDFRQAIPDWTSEAVECRIVLESARLEDCQLALSATQLAEGLRAEITFDESFIDRLEAAQLADCLSVLWSDAIARPFSAADDLVWAPESSWQIIGAANQTDALFSAGTVHDLIERIAVRQPDAPAVLDERTALTFGELLARAEAIRLRLLRRGISPESRVAVLMNRGPGMVSALLGIWRCGAAYVPLPAGSKLRLAGICESGAISVVVVDAATSLEQMPAGVEVLRVDEEEREAAARGEENVPVGIDPEWAAYVMYTSGSTGEPKGVVVSHRALANYVQWAMEYYAVGSGERGAAVFTPLSFDLTVTSLWVPLAAGKSIRMGAGGEGVEELVEVAGEGVRDGLWKVTPAHLVALGECQGRVAAGPGALVAGGEALSGEHLEWWFEQAPESRVYNEYGPTETTVGCSVYRAQRGHKGAIPIGRPIANTQIYVLDEGMRLTPVGVAGELYIGGAGVARGYLERPEATAARFVPNPFGKAGSRLYRSGDGGRWNGQGELEYLGRGDQQVKLRGYRIELGEIEAVLRQGPGVRDCAVVVREGGAGQKMLVAYVAARGARGISWEELREWMAERLPDYMTPQSMVQMERLPLTANGKIDREHLPAAGQEREERSYSGPESAAERLLAGIWEKLLGVERIGVEDNFFELGGDSILSIQAVARAREGGLRLTPKQMFEQQTIRGLGKVGRWEKGQEEEKRGAAAGEVAATPIQKWFWEEQGESGGREHFNQAVLLEGAGVRREALRAAVAGVLRQHDAVRLRWRRREGEWEQSYGTGEAGGLEVVDLSGVEEEERSKAIEGVCEAAQGGLRVEEGPLLRAVWMELGEGAGGRLLVVGHHLIVDGVSWRILLEDLQKGYGQAERGEGIELGRGSSTYQEWSRRLWEWGGGARVQGELAYWEGELGGGGGLKWGEGEGGGLAGEAREVRRGLGVERTRQLLQERGGAGGGQAQELLLAGLGRGLEPWMRGSGVVVEVEGHGREALGEGEAEELDVTRTVGWFTSLYPVVVEGWRGRGAGEVLEEMKERWRRVPGKGLGYGLLRYGGGEGEARLKRAGKAEISFNYLGQFDQALERGGQWKGAREGSGRAQSAEARRTHQLDIVAAVVGGRLQVSWYYAPRHMGEGEAEALADRYMEGVELLIAHCQAGGAAAYTAADFPLAHLTAAELNGIAGERGLVEDIYPLTPLQQGMLFHTLYAPGSDVYFDQVGARIYGDLNIDALRQAWEIAASQHSPLRISILPDAMHGPVQVVWSKVSIPWRIEDWRGRPAAGQQASWREFAGGDRARGFDIKIAPLFRLTLVRLEDQVYEFLWSHHHVLLDGWSASALLRQILQHYAELTSGRRPNPPELAPFKDYIQWIGTQDVSAAESFWRSTLKGFRSPALLSARHSWWTGSGRQRYAIAEIRLSAGSTSRLNAFSRKNRITLATLGQAAWSLTIAAASGAGEVLYGLIVSGRSAEIPGIETMTGLFINTVPVRVSLRPAETALRWLHRLSAEQAEIRRFEHSPLSEVRRWSETPAGLPFFESVFIFENYPGEDGFAGCIENAKLRLEFSPTARHTNYPLAILVIPGDEMLLRITYMRECFDLTQVETMLRQMEQALGLFCGQPRLTLEALFGAMTGSGQPSRNAAGGPLQAINPQSINKPKLRATRRKSFPVQF